MRLERLARHLEDVASNRKRPGKDDGRREQRQRRERSRHERENREAHRGTAQHGSTALGTALNQAYFGERVAFFGIVVGVALLLAGIGFIVLTIGGALRQRVGATPLLATANEAIPTEPEPAHSRELTGVR